MSHLPPHHPTVDRSGALRQADACDRAAARLAATAAAVAASGRRAQLTWLGNDAESFRLQLRRFEDRTAERVAELRRHAGRLRAAAEVAPR